MPDVTQALLNSLINAPLLIGDLPDATSFDRTSLSIKKTTDKLNINQKLGHLYEDALALALQSSSVITLLGQNIQVFDNNKQTIGELDFILTDKRYGKNIHLELGVKFYLAVKNPTGWHFPGPNSRDNWSKKLARMQEHQLQLSRQPEAKEMLRSHYGLENIESQHLIYGCLFTPINHNGHPPRLQFMADNARTGTWLYADQWSDYLAQYEEIYYIPKPLWPVIPEPNCTSLFEQYSSTEFINKFRSRGAMFTTPDFNHTYFLAADTWPQPQ